MPSWFGSGGVTVEEPSRTYPAQGTTLEAPDFTGGARGPASIPSRTVAPRLARPAPPDPRRAGPVGPVSFHRGAFVENAAVPSLHVGGEMFHSYLPWSRPKYPNIAGQMGYHTPTDMPSWTANRPGASGPPRSPIPYSRKSIANFMVRETFGATRQNFPGGSLAGFVSGIQRGLIQEGKGWRARSKIGRPRFSALSAWGQAGSYGQTTPTLNTTPANASVQATPHGLY